MKNNPAVVLSKRSNFTNLLFILLLLSLTTVMVGCSDKPDDDQTKSAQKDAKGKKGDKDKEEEKAPIPVEVVNVSRGDIQQTYRTITTLEAERDADVVARSTGIVEKILVEEGDMVEKGQLLAQLDVEQLTLELAQTEATLSKLKNELDRQKSLAKRKLGQNDQLDRAKYEYQSQQAQFELSKLRLRYASIKAPISGIVTERMIKPGNLIRDNDKLFKIVDLNSLIAVLHLPEKELGNVKKQQLVVLDIDAMQGRPVMGEIDRIRPAIDTETGTFRVIARLNNENLFLKSGMFGKVEVVFDEHQDSLILQQDAVITQDNRSHVFIVNDGLAKQTPIEVGFKHKGMVEVLNGLSETDQVIVTGQQILKHDTKVAVIGNDSSAQASASH